MTRKLIHQLPDGGMIRSTDQLAIDREVDGEIKTFRVPPPMPSSPVDPTGDSASVAYTFDLEWDGANNRFTGNFYPEIAELPIATLIAFRTPSDIPDVDVPASLLLPVGGVAQSFELFEWTGTPGDDPVDISVQDVSSSILYWGIVSARTRIWIISSSGAEAFARRAHRRITNADLKSLDTNYIELIPSPGPGKYISINDVIIKKTGDNFPRVYQGYAKIWSQPEAVATEEAGEASGSRLSGNFNSVTRSVNGSHVSVEEWENEDRYVYLAVADTMREPSEISWDDSGDFRLDFANSFTEVPGGIRLTAQPRENLLDGGEVRCRLWRSNVTYNSSGLFIFTTGVWATSANLYLSGESRGSHIQAEPTMAHLARYANASVGYITNDMVAMPLTSAGEFSSAYSIAFVNPLNRIGSHTFAVGVGQQPLIENSGVFFGPVFIWARPEGSHVRNYAPDIWDDLLLGVDDVEFDVILQYEIRESG